LTLGENNTTKVEGNVNLVGGATFNIGDSAQLDVDGNLSLSGTSNFIATDNSQTFICGNRPAANTAGVSVTIFCGDLGDGATNCASYDGCRILPVDFAGFDAKFDGQAIAVNLTWSTAKEWNNSHFEIERSIGGVTDFKKIGEVTGKGWSDDLSNYAHVDNTLPNGKAIAYYRIRQVDFDGKSSISKVISVQVEVANETKSAWQAYPNPVRDNQINIKLLDYSTFSGEKIQARIVHANMVAASQELGSVEELNAFLQQQISRIPKGVFVIEIKWADKIEHLKMLKAQ
jgi:hypothetical protein